MDGHGARDPLSGAPELCRLSAADLAAGYRSGAFSPLEVAEACLARAEAIQPALNAFTLIDHDGARSAAAAATARWAAGSPLSPLDGVPGTVKDIVWIRGLPVTYGSRALDPVTAAADAPAVARLRAAGLVILGITTTPEFGWKAVTDSAAFGITRNPWDPARTPGGSSGGAAVAAATGCGVVHLGTDGGGSIRIPAGFTGIAGLKPTFGRVPAYPMSAFGTVAHLGPMARSAADLAAMLAVMDGPDPQDWYQPPGTFPPLDAAFAWAGARVGVWGRPPGGTVDPAVGAAFSAALARLDGLGARLTPIDLPGEDVAEVFRVHWFGGAAARLRDVAPDRRHGIDPGFLATAEAGAAYSAADMLQAASARGRFGHGMDVLLSRLDLVVSPATAIPAFGAGLEVPAGSGLARWTDWAGFSYPINLSQQPAAVVPMGFTPGGLPLGLQIIGARGADGRVLAAAAAWEAAGDTQTPRKGVTA